VKPAPSTSLVEPQFAVPALPPHFAKAAQPSPASSNAARKPSAAIKHSFPDAHLPYLLQKITELTTSSLVVLVDAAYQDLKQYKVRKKAIEAKVREMCEKDDRHVWAVKSGFPVSAAVDTGVHRVVYVPPLQIPSSAN